LRFQNRSCPSKRPLPDALRGYFDTSKPPVSNGAQARKRQLPET
jgi:hypothetical protein